MIIVIALIGLEKVRDAPSVFTRSGVMMSEGVITTMLYQNRLLSVSVGGPLEDEKKIPIRTSTNCYSLYYGISPSFFYGLQLQFYLSNLNLKFIKMSLYKPIWPDYLKWRIEIRDGPKVAISQRVIKLNFIYGCTKAYGHSRRKHHLCYDHIPDVWSNFACYITIQHGI